MTKRESGQCLGHSCGWNAYRRELTARKKKDAAETNSAADALAREEADRKERERLGEEALEELAAAVEGNGPWPVWMTMTIDELETEGERQAADERLMQERQRAEADLLLAIAAAEDEALTIRSRERLALAQVERLRTIYAATTGATMFGTAHRDISPTR